MSLSEEYKLQFSWRKWSDIFDALPSLKGQAVLDLGCALGDQTAELVSRGAYVIGIDMDERLLSEAQSRRLDNAEFLLSDIRKPLNLEKLVNGVWSSFSAAYIPDLADTLTVWGKYLHPKGWIALTDIDDLFGHEPLCDKVKTLLNAYCEESISEKRYDFRVGRKLKEVMVQAGFKVTNEITVEDQELSFNGPALPEVVNAWQNRFNRMKLLQDFCGPDFDQVKNEFLECLQNPAHRSIAKIYCCIGAKQETAT